MKPNLLSPIHRIIFSLLAGAALGGLLPWSARAATFATWAEAVSGSYFLTQQPFVWVGDQPPSETESQELWIVLDNWRANGYRTGAQDIELFLQTYTNSPWAPSLHASLGKFYLDNGRITLALEHWEQAWLMTQAYPDGYGKRVADFTLAD